MKIVAKNKRATYDYEISERLVAGIVLAGHEVKSVKVGHISLKGSFITIHGSEAYLAGAHITQYKHAANIKGYDPVQSRKMLLHRREIDHIISAIQSQGMTVVPIVVGIERGLVKVEIGIGRGKKRYDKRETIKKRDMLRDVNRDIRSKDKK